MDAARSLPRSRIVAEPLQIGVNLSPVQFRFGDLAGLVHAILLETGLSPGRLELEITEGVLISDPPRALVDPAAAQSRSGSRSRWTISARATHRCPRCSRFRSTRSRSTAASSQGGLQRAIGGDRAHRPRPRPRSKCRLSPRASRPKPSAVSSCTKAARKCQGYLVGRPRPIASYAGLTDRPVARAGNAQVGAHRKPGRSARAPGRR